MCKNPISVFRHKVLFIFIQTLAMYFCIDLCSYSYKSHLWTSVLSCVYILCKSHLCISVSSCVYICANPISEQLDGKKRC